MRIRPIIKNNLLLIFHQRQLEIETQNQEIEKGFLKVYQDRPFSISVPAIVGHDWEFSNLYLKLSFDLTNRLPKESFLTQRNNMIQIGYGIDIMRD